MNTLNKFTALALASCLSLTFISCEGDDKNDNTTALLGLVYAQQEAAKKCETNFTTGNNTNQLICTPSAGKGRHFRLEGIKANRSENANAAFYVGFGQDSALVGANTTPVATAGSNKLLFTFYSGSFTGSAPYGLVFANFSSQTYYATTTGTTGGTSLYNDYVVSESPETASTRVTVCFDVTSSTPPRVTFWATGKNGADCSNTGSLSLANALWSKNDWTTNAPIADGSIVIKTASNASGIYVTKVAVSSESAVK
ncbi:hypothetical protein [Leptospira idonii]|uniref:Uncharacterized protein n=1 Tax=Leptospira idonii TaxID=1193500 RepID=A0A4R9M2N4_9LEPT|nr:hypothetical protein [Leptospira idonii]TGN20241.1 hypothetical protein EHS15_04715 [Leptospira idonii]